MNQDILKELNALLLQKYEYTGTDNKVLRAKVTELALNSDVGLLDLLLSNEKIKKYFFTQVRDILVFDKIKFQKLLNLKSFMPDSYTYFKNKIGLVDIHNNDFINSQTNVVLSFPYKDGILHGEQSSDEQKMREKIYHETLKSIEIDQLLKPKVIMNAIKYSATNQGVQESVANKISVDDNLIIKGNNLETLYSLKEVYANKIKCIYIDPPYNTGNDSFNYNDTYNHSTWLSFMKNRLEIARELLKDDGSIWISINDDEVHYLKVLCDEIFGRENFVATVIWHSKYTISNDSKYISYQHENILIYAKNKKVFKIGMFERTESANKDYKNPDNDPKGKWKATPLHAKSGTENSIYSVTFDNGITWSTPKGRFARYSKENLIKFYENNELYFNSKGGVDKKTYLSEVKQGISSGTVWDETSEQINSIWNYSEVGHTHYNNEELALILGKGVFDNPKGTKLILKILKIANVNQNDIILDFFAGSGTTAHAVLELNRQDNGNRKFILVEQINYAKSITAERIRRVIHNYSLANPMIQSDESFIYCELAPFNQKYIELIQLAEDTDELINIANAIKINQKQSLLDYRVDINKIDFDKEFLSLDFKEKKEFLISLFDKNMNYIPYSEIDDETHNFSEEIKTLNHDFYQNNRYNPKEWLGINQEIIE